MGITGLIPFLEKASSRMHLKDLRGSTVAVDTYCWLHKGVFSCAEKLVRGEETDLYLQYCLKYVHMLLSFDIKPILVFDGRHLPAKAITEKRRRESRQQSRKRAAELLRLGQIEEARSHMRRCVDVTHKMALRLISECRKRNVDCITAPYEADAQLAWLNKVNLAQYVITEDSDLTLFGARSVIFKLDLTGAGLLIESNKLYLAMGCHKERFTFDKFRRMCILSGCDYLDSLPGIGLAKACKFMLKTEEENMWRALKKIPQYLNMKTLEVDDEYIENFLKAESTFKHMYIYNPLKRKMERLHELEEFQTDERFCTNAGTLLEDDEQAFQLALGNLNPFTLQKLDNWHPDKDLKLLLAMPKKSKCAKHKSIWLANNFETQSAGSSKSDFCALQFKKVDFIRQTLVEDINNSIKEEEEKPAEMDIFSMYRNETVGDCIESYLKRRRESSSSLTDNDNDDATSTSSSPPASPRRISANRNPFAKPQTDRNIHTSPVICKRGSLLKVRDAQKNHLSNESAQDSNRSWKAKHSVFHEEQKILVKSRLFAANVKQVIQLQRKQPVTRDLSNEIDKIESLSQQMHDNRQQLYNHTSPSSPTKKMLVPEESKQNIFNNHDLDIEPESLSTEIDIKDEGSCSDICQKSEISESIPLSDNEAENNTESIAISDDDVAQSSSLPINNTLALAKFKQLRAPRLGLTKPKTAITKTKTANVSSLQQNQTRLSMFGFQKRPKLK